MNTTFHIVIVFAVVICFLEACGQNSLKQSLLRKSRWLYAVGIVFYVSVGYMLHVAYHQVGLGEMNLVWSCLSIIAALSVGYYLYDEPMNLYTGMALLFALLAIYSASLSRNYSDIKTIG